MLPGLRLLALGGERAGQRGLLTSLTLPTYPFSLIASAAFLGAEQVRLCVDRCRQRCVDRWVVDRCVDSVRCVDSLRSVELRVFASIDRV